MTQKAAYHKEKTGQCSYMRTENPTPHTAKKEKRSAVGEEHPGHTHGLSGMVTGIQMNSHRLVRDHSKHGQNAANPQHEPYATVRGHAQRPATSQQLPANEGGRTHKSTATTRL